MTFADCVKVLLTVVAAGVCAGAAGQEGSGLPASRPAATQPTQPTQPADAAAPRLELHPTEFDFGTVWQGQTAEREFTVKNAGPAPLVLSVESTCGCTAVSEPRSPLAPGESTRFLIRYDTTRLGPVQKTVTVNSNDLSRAKLPIEVRGTVKPLCLVTPESRVTFTELGLDTLDSQTLKIESQYDRPLSLKLQAGQDLGHFDAVLTEVKPGVEYELKITTRPPLNVGWDDTIVRVDCGLDKFAPLTIPVGARVAPRAEVVSPGLGVFPTATQPKPHVVRIQYLADQPLKITKVQASLPSIRWQIGPADGVPTGRRMAYSEVTVTLPAYRDVPPDGATVEIFTDDPTPEFQKLVLPVVRRPLPPGKRR